MTSASQSIQAVGFVGLGQMGGPMANNLATYLHPHDATLYCFDKAGTEGRLPDGALPVDSVEALVRQADTVFLSLPDGAVSRSVVEQMVAVDDRRTRLVVDLSTIGPTVAREINELLAGHSMQYADAPVSGGRSGAIAATISLMWAGPADQFEAHKAMLGAMAGNVFLVGEQPGQGQALKLLNNFLSATAMAATSEAIQFGQSQGIPMKTMLDVVNVSSGQNTAISDKFPKRILTETYDAGFSTGLMAKDVALFMEHVRAEKSPVAVGELVESLWRSCEQEYGPGSDFTRIFQLVAARKGVE